MFAHDALHFVSNFISSETRSFKDSISNFPVVLNAKNFEHSCMRDVTLEL